MFFTSGKHKEKGLKFNPLKAIIAPRPIGWISSYSHDNDTGKKIANLAPYSFFNAISEQPPMIGFCAAADRVRDKADNKNTALKDSARNILKNKDFVVNIVGRDMLDDMHKTSAPLPHNISEFSYADIDMTGAELVDAPMVKNAPCHLECRLWQSIELPSSHQENGNLWIMSNIIGFHIRDEFIKDGLLDVGLYNPVARLGYNDYCHVNNVTSRPPMMA